MRHDCNWNSVLLIFFFKLEKIKHLKYISILLESNFVLLWATKLCLLNGLFLLQRGKMSPGDQCRFYLVLAHFLMSKKQRSFQRFMNFSYQKGLLHFVPSLILPIFYFPKMSTYMLLILLQHNVITVVFTEGFKDGIFSLKKVCFPIILCL